MESWGHRVGTFKICKTTWLPSRLVWLLPSLLLTIPLKMEGKQVRQNKKGGTCEVS